MSENSRNIAQIGRKFAGMTQERWAEALGYSVRYVAGWERGEQTPPLDAVVRMVDLTGQQVLAYWYLVDQMHAVIPSGKSVIPDIEVKDIAQATLALLRRLQDFGRKNRVDELVEIAEDGRIDDKERADFQTILRELDDIVKAAMAVRFAKEASDGTDR
jgi:transcriptional regulator with XRE-family HTH domain